MGLNTPRKYIIPLRQNGRRVRASYFFFVLMRVWKSSFIAVSRFKKLLAVTGPVPQGPLCTDISQVASP